MTGVPSSRVRGHRKETGSDKGHSGTKAEKAALTDGLGGAVSLSLAKQHHIHNAKSDKK